MGDIEYNEQRIRDVEIPLHQLEQRVLQLEGQMSNFNNDVICQTICAKINQNLKTSLPSLWYDLSRIKNELDNKESNITGECCAAKT